MEQPELVMIFLTVLGAPLTLKHFMKIHVIVIPAKSKRGREEGDGTENLLMPLFFAVAEKSVPPLDFLAFLLLRFSLLFGAFSFLFQGCWGLPCLKRKENRKPKKQGNPKTKEIQKTKGRDRKCHKLS